MRYAWTPKFQLSGPTVHSYTVDLAQLCDKPVLGWQNVLHQVCGVFPEVRVKLQSVVLLYYEILIHCMLSKYLHRADVKERVLFHAIGQIKVLGIN